MLRKGVSPLKDSYQDIEERINEEPVWWDENGCPRYEKPHHPEHLMARIRCQACKRIFWVSFVDGVYNMSGYRCGQDRHSDRFGDYKCNVTVMGCSQVETIKEIHDSWVEEKDGMTVYKKEPGILNKSLKCEDKKLVDNYHYGDPPRHGGCIGETMNSEPEWEWEELDADEGAVLAGGSG